MTYALYNWQQQWLAPFHRANRLLTPWLDHPMHRAAPSALTQALTANQRAFDFTTRNRNKPSWNIPTADVIDEVVLDHPFCSLRRFSKQGRKDNGFAPMLLVAPLSGHYATLLRETVDCFVTDRDVWITDWKNCRDVPADAGGFGVEDYIDLISEIIDHLATPADVVAVCQPCPLVLATLALRAQREAPLAPRSLILIGGPVDPAAAPTKVTKHADSQNLAFFNRAMIDVVPANFAGKGRRIYPGYLQLMGFMAMQPQRHAQAVVDWFTNLHRSKEAKAQKFESFYDEYFTVMDLPAEFFLETVERIFKKNQLATGQLSHRGQRVDLTAIKGTAMMTIEGARDDISAPGQTSAAHLLCPNVSVRRHITHPDVGHYGLFSGRKFRAQIAPEMTAFFAGIPPLNPLGQ
ncbi:MAG: polyhydroxyalkanoate depolymerase [Alphaproteobacteria bacterium]|nr:polyhydroxyalkanoate depolymerase [Alphaproteobacteria bacterium]